MTCAVCAVVVLCVLAAGPPPPAKAAERAAPSDTSVTLDRSHGIASTPESPKAVRRDNDGDGRPDRSGETVRVAGRVSTEVGLVRENAMAIQSDGWGITIIIPGGSDVVRGDSVIVDGVVEQENGRTQVRATTYSVLLVPPRVPEPTSIRLEQAIGERYESVLVEATGQVGDVSSNRGGNYLTIKATGLGDVLTVFVHNHRLDELPLADFETGDKVTVTGVLLQHDYTSPYTSYYEILPRSSSDLVRAARSRTFYRNVILVSGLLILLAIGAVVLLRVQVRRRTQQLADSQRRLRRLAEATFEGIVIHQNGEILDVNQAITDLTGYHREELIGRNALDFVSQSTRSITAAQMGDGLGEPYEAVLVRKDGTTFPVDIQAKTMEGASGHLRIVAIRDASQRKEDEAELLLAKQEAEKVARLKSSLLNNMSHELRTPITSIIGYAELIMEEAPDTHDLFAYRIRQSGRRLSETLRSVLDMAQIEAGTMDLHIADVDTGRLASEVISAHEPMAQEAGLALYLDADAAPTFPTDRILCYRILTHLVHNAIKFTNDGHVRVTVESSNPGVLFTVSDTGIGIHDTFLPHLFEPFQQESDGRTRTHDGTGLGLAITKRMVDLLRGHIRVDSTKGEGSTIAVDVPPSLTYDGGPVRGDSRVVPEPNTDACLASGDALPGQTPEAESTPLCANGEDGEEDSAIVQSDDESTPRPDSS